MNAGENNVGMILKNKEQDHVGEVTVKQLDQPELLKQQFQQLTQVVTPKPLQEQAQQVTQQQKLLKQPMLLLQEVPEQLNTSVQQIPLPQLQPTKQSIVQSQSLQHPNETSSTHSLSEYLAQLLKDHRQLSALPNIFMHIDRLLDEEIANVRASLFSLPKHSMILPPPEGPIVVLNEKVYVPVKEYPDFNFVGRLLGPRGMTAKQLEIDTGCKIMVRGKGSMRNKHEEETNRGKPNWEHLSDELHILITAEDTENRAKIKLEQAVNEIKKFLVPLAEGEDELKKRQLMELAIINGTYRDTTTRNTSSTNFPHCCEGDWRRRPTGCGPTNAADSHMIAANNAITGMQGPVRAGNPPPLGTPFILSQLAATPGGAGATGNYNDGPQTPHMILVPYGDCANYAAFTSNSLLNDYNENNMSGLKEHQRRVANRNHANRHQVGIAGKNGYRVN